MVKIKKRLPREEHPASMGLKREELVAGLILAKQNMAQAKERFEYYQDLLASSMREEKRKTLTSNVLDSRYKVSFVQTTRVVVNEVGLRKALGVKSWNKITDRKFSKAKLEKALDEDLIDVNVVSPFIEEVDNKAFLRVSEVKDEADEA